MCQDAFQVKRRQTLGGGSAVAFSRTRLFCASSSPMGHGDFGWLLFPGDQGFGGTVTEKGTSPDGTDIVDPERGVRVPVEAATWKTETDPERVGTKRKFPEGSREMLTGHPPVVWLDEQVLVELRGIGQG